MPLPALWQGHKKHSMLLWISTASVLYGRFTLTGLRQQCFDWKIYFPDCQLSPLDELSVLV